MDTPGQPADMRHRLSTLPAPPLPSLPSVPTPAPPVTPVPLPAAADSGPTGSLSGSTRHNLPRCLPTAAPLLPVAAPPAARTTPPDSPRLHTPFASHSPVAPPALLPLHSAAAL